MSAVLSGNCQSGYTSIDSCAEDSAPYSISSLGNHLEVLARNAAQFEEPDQCFFNQIIRTRCPGSDADDGRAAW